MFGATPNRNAFAGHRRRGPTTFAYRQGHLPVNPNFAPPIDPPLMPPSSTHYQDQPPSTTVGSQAPASASNYLPNNPDTIAVFNHLVQPPHNQLINHAVQSDLNVQSEISAQFQINPDPDLPRLPTLPTQDDDVIKIFRMMEDTTKQVKVEIVEDENQNSKESDDLPFEMRTECGMCFDSYSLGQEKCRLPCKHTFHKECVMKWLIENRKNQCPLCRYKVTDPPISSKSKPRVNQFLNF